MERLTDTEVIPSSDSRNKGSDEGLFAAKNPSSRVHETGIPRPIHKIQPGSHEDGSDPTAYTILRLSANESLAKATRIVCERYGIELSLLSPIQRKFITHYRCSQCGLLPLYNVNLLHIKRARCMKCHQLVAFRRTGKYGKLRKDIAIVLGSTIRGDVNSYV